MIVDCFEGSYTNFSSVTGIPYSTIQKWASRRESPPNETYLVKLLSLEIPDSYKEKIAHAFIYESWQKKLSRIYEGEQSNRTQPEKLLELKEIPIKVKKEWQDYISKYKQSHNLTLPDFDKKRTFPSILRDYFINNEEPNFIGFIKKLSEEWGIGPSKLSVILNCSDNDVRRWVYQDGDSKLERMIPTSTTIEKIIKARDLNEYDAARFWRVCRGDKKLGTVDDCIKEYSEKMRLADNFKSKDETSKEFFLKLLKITGVSDKNLTKISKINKDRMLSYTTGNAFLEGAYTTSPKEAFALAKALAPYSDLAANNIAAIFLHVPEYKSKDDIKKSFIEGEMPLNQVFQQTRLLHAKMNATDFAQTLGMRSNGTIHSFEQQRVNKTILPDFSIALAKKHLGIKGSEEMRLFVKAIFDELKNRGLDLDLRFSNRFAKIGAISGSDLRQLR